MYSPEIHYLVHKEMYKDLQRDIARYQLIQMAMFQQPDGEELLRKIAGKIGIQMVKWGSKLQHYGRVQHHNTLTQQG